jgi:C4-dicarboxylate-specific signal transduction histidine kinase
MRIRKKLVVLHTCFSLALAAILLIALRPALRDVVSRAEMSEARSVLDAVAPALLAGRDADDAVGPIVTNLGIRAGSARELGLTPETAGTATQSPGRVVEGESDLFGPCAVMFVPQPAPGGSFRALVVNVPEARRAVTRLYGLVIGSLLAVYALVALALEALVLPQSVYAPIRRMLAADAAVRDGMPAAELIPESAIPEDELGEIMRSRNETVRRLRHQESALAEALTRLESVAHDLRRKNHLLETAQRNLADADRLASLGMMSAGIAHELNTPLAVLKGLVERLHADPSAGVEPERAALMLRVVGRLERLSESLLDFARARPADTRPIAVRGVIQESITLVGLDRDAGSIPIHNRVSESVVVDCDPDRMVQVFVNLIRNAVDAVRSGPADPGEPPPGIEIDVVTTTRDGRAWHSVRIIDDGPGIDSAILPHLFEPFASTRLDSHGTGLGLAVAEGIVGEHAGVILARNRTDRRGAVFEVMLPAREPGASVHSGAETDHAAGV